MSTIVFYVNIVVFCEPSGFGPSHRCSLPLCLGWHALASPLAMSLCVWRTEATGHWCQRCAWQWSSGAVGPEYRLGLSTSPEVRIPHRLRPSLHNSTFLSQCRRPESTPRAKARPCCPTKSMKEGTKKAMMKSAEVIALSPLPHRRWKR